MQVLRLKSTVHLEVRDAGLLPEQAPLIAMLRIGLSPEAVRQVLLQRPRLKDRWVRSIAGRTYVVE